MNNPVQKIISFSSQRSDVDKIKQSIDEGWSIVKLMPNNGYFIGVMEKIASDCLQNEKVYIPPRKKIIFG